VPRGGDPLAGDDGGEHVVQAEAALAHALEAIAVHRAASDRVLLPVPARLAVAQELEQRAAPPQGQLQRGAVGRVRRDGAQPLVDAGPTVGPGHRDQAQVVELAGAEVLDVLAEHGHVDRRLQPVVFLGVEHEGRVDLLEHDAQVGRPAAILADRDGVAVRRLPPVGGEDHARVAGEILAQAVGERAPAGLVLVAGADHQRDVGESHFRSQVMSGAKSCQEPSHALRSAC
jgi:hypothetical protein